VSRASPTIFLSAGEPSGDLHGGALARALRRRWPAARLYGLGGPHMAAAGVELLADLRELAVMGFVEVAARLPYFLRLLRRLRREITSRGTELVVTIDYPGLNLRLAGAAHDSGIPVLYYIAPQVWAWHVSRVAQLARCVDRLAVILPFEESLFRQAGADARYVGHPLLDQLAPPLDRQTFARSIGVEPERTLLALFPGSRRQEVSRHLRCFVEAAELLRAERPELQPVIAAADSVASRDYAGAPFPRTADARSLLAHSGAAFVKSGTSTLEAALAGVPMVIAYRAQPLTFQIARRLVRVDHVGLVNLVAGGRIVPELLQGDATPDALAAALRPLLPGGADHERTRAALLAVRAALADGNGSGAEAGSVAERVAMMAAELLAD
jgi:lipid-A-disaccharide synthase